MTLWGDDSGRTAGAPKRLAGNAENRSGVAIASYILAYGSISAYINRMSNPSLVSVLALLRAQARIEEQFAPALGSVHGLALKELLLLMNLEQAPRTRLSRIDLARRLHVSASTVTRIAASVVSIERYRTLADSARARLEKLGYFNIEVMLGDGFDIRL